jgi:hypothetical protein
MNNERPRKEYVLTSEGQNLLNFTEDSLNFICKKIGTPGVQKDMMVGGRTTGPILRSFLRKTEETRPII